MIVFWIAAALLSAGTAVLIVRQAARAGGAAGPREDPALGVYRRQLAEIDDLAERGLMPQAERRSVRAEAARRMLAAADTRAEDGGLGVGAAAGRRTVLAAAAGAPLLALALYLWFGSPGAPDQPFAARLAAWRAADPSRLAPEQMGALLEGVVAARPNDIQARYYLARAEMAAGDTAAAQERLQQALRLAPNRADLWAALGETLVDPSGNVPADAQSAFERAVRLDPHAVGPRYFLARARIAGGDVKSGVADWRALAADLPAADPRRAGLGAEADAVERSGGLAPAVGAATPDPAQRQAFIGAMVQSLATRLKSQPDDPDGWARLIRAYGVLGDEPKRAAAVAEERRFYAGRPGVAAAIEAKAQGPVG